MNPKINQLQHYWNGVYSLGRLTDVNVGKLKPAAARTARGQGAGDDRGLRNLGQSGPAGV